MFLIEYQSYTYVNAEDIVYLNFGQSGVGFCLRGDETYYSVECGFEDKNSSCIKISFRFRIWNGAAKVLVDIHDIVSSMTQKFGNGKWHLLSRSSSSWRILDSPVDG